MGAGVIKKGEVKNEPNVVPMIDIMLVLLIIFMIVTPVISSGFQARIPQGKNIESSPEEQGDVLLGIDRDGNFYIGMDNEQGSSTISPVPAGQLEDVLTQIYSMRATDKILYFKADAELPYSVIEAAIEIARSAGVRVLAAVTEEKREGGVFGGGGGD